MKKQILFIILIGACPFIFCQDTLPSSCIFYIGAENKIDCLQLGITNPADFNSADGTINRNSIFKPKDTGIAYIHYKKDIYKVKVLVCPDPDMVFEGFPDSKTVKKDMLVSGKRIVPLLRDFPFDMYITMKGMELSLLDKNRKEIISKSELGNYVLFSKDDVKNAKYLLIKSVTISVSDNSEQGYSRKTILCNKEFEIVK